MTALTFEVSLPYRELSPNGYKHWRTVSAAKREYRREVCLVATYAAREQGWQRPARAVVSLAFGIKGGRQVQRYQPQDEANALNAFKAGLDGIVDAGVVADDSRKHLSIGRVEITSDDGPFVRVEVVRL